MFELRPSSSSPLKRASVVCEREEEDGEKHTGSAISFRWWCFAFTHGAASPSEERNVRLRYNNYNNTNNVAAEVVDDSTIKPSHKLMCW